MPFYTNNQKQLTMIETKFTLYRLRIESFMAGVPASESETKMIAEFILKHLMDIAFLDGNGERTTAGK